MSWGAVALNRHADDIKAVPSTAIEALQPITDKELPRTETLYGKTPWEFACGWYSENDITNSIARRARTDKRDPSYIPDDIDGCAFAFWLTEQYRLAMRKGIEIGQRASVTTIEALRRELADAKGEVERLRTVVSQYQSFCSECGSSNLIDMVEATEPGHRYCGDCKQELFKSLHYIASITSHLQANAALTTTVERLEREMDEAKDKLLELRNNSTPGSEYRVALFEELTAMLIAKSKAKLAENSERLDTPMGGESPWTGQRGDGF